MAINVSIRYNGGFLPDMILLVLCCYHRGTQQVLSLQPINIMFPPNLFDNLPPSCLGDVQKVYIRSEFSLNNKNSIIRRSRCVQIFLVCSMYFYY